MSRTSASFSHCTDGSIELPSSVEEKPHCGERHRRSSGTILAASAMRSRMRSGSSSSAVLVVTRPRTTRWSVSVGR